MLAKLKVRILEKYRSQSVFAAACGRGRTGKTGFRESSKKEMLHHLRTGS